MSSALRTHGLSKRFGPLIALHPLDLELGLLPPRARGGQPLALGFVITAALGAAWVLTGPLRGRGAERDAPLAEAELSTARREREAIYEAIRDLDYDFETGKVEAADHTRLRDELRGRAAGLLQAERAADRGSEPVRSERGPSMGRSCAQCGAAADPAHRFCAQCGATLAAPRGAA